MSGWNRDWEGRRAAARVERQKRKWLSPREQVPLKLAMDVVKESAWTFIRKPPMPAPGYANRVVQGKHGLYVEFGANKFLVGRAAERARVVLNQAYDAIENGKCVVRNDLTSSLHACVEKSVADFKNDEYGSAYPVRGGSMEFGGNGILVSQAAAVLRRWSGILPFLTDPD
jgi:hypothetical protein